MKYDLSNPLHRKQFIAKCNKLLKEKVRVVSLKDDTTRTLKQNSYLHVLIRVMALETGVSEHYSKEVYFKELANPELFVRESVDKITGEVRKYNRSSSELTTEEMTRAINIFRRWAEDNGYYLPDANDPDENGEVSFKSEREEEAFHQADIETQRASALINIEE